MRQSTKLPIHSTTAAMRLAAILLFFAMSGLLAGCDVVLGTPATPTLRPPTSDLEYSFVTGVNLAEGEFAPGEVVQFVDTGDSGIQVTISGQAATKQIGDSFSWSYSPAPGLTANYELRLLPVILDRLQASGTVTVQVLNPQPQPASLPTDSSLRYDNAVVTYGVRRGENIPGTTWSYIGYDENQGAQLGGTDGFPYRKTGDSVNWTGALTPNTYLQLNLRVISADEENLNLGGTASLLVQ